MSKTFTSRPTQTRGRGAATNQPNNRNTRPPGIMDQGRQVGRGRGRGTAGNPAGIRATDGADVELGATGRGQELGQRMTYQGGFTMITPNEKKRQEISQMAKRETDIYNQYKQQNTPKTFSYQGTAGGGLLTEGEARRKLVQSSPNKTQKLLQKETLRSETKRREDAEMEKKKLEQRRKAELNERRKLEEEQQQGTKWDESRRRTNEAFLRRFEKQARGKVAKAGSTGEAKEQESYTEEQTNSRDLAGAVGGAVTTDGGPASEDHMTPEQEGSFLQFMEMFPNEDYETLLRTFKDVDCDLASAVDSMEYYS